MSFPRNNLCLTFLDAPVSSLGTPLRLYLPLKRSVKYFKFFNRSPDIFLHTTLLPEKIQAAVREFLPHCSSPYSILTDQLIESFFPHVASLVEHIEEKRRFNRWMKLVGRVEKWKTPHPQQLKKAQGFNVKKQTLCSILLYFALSKKKVKQMFNL